MKKLKKFENFVNEELSPATYRRAAKELEDKGQKDTADRMRSHAKSIGDKDRAQEEEARKIRSAKMREGKPQYDVEVNFNVEWGFNSQGEEVLFRETSRAIAPKRRYELITRDQIENKDDTTTLPLQGVYDNGEQVDDNDFVMFWDAGDNEYGVRDFMVRVDIGENGKLKLDHFNGKCASRRDAMQLALFFELLYNNDIDKDKDWGFVNFIDENFGDFDSFNQIMDIRTFY